MTSYYITCDECEFSRTVEGLQNAKDALWDHSKSRDHAVVAHGAMA